MSATTEPTAAPAGARSRPAAGALIERFGLVLAWLLIIAVFGALEPDVFLTQANFSTIFGSQAVLVIVTLGLLIPLTAGDYDLSIAGVLSISAMLLAVLNAQEGVPLGLAILAALGAGALVGAINGAFVMLFRIDPFIVTLGTGTVLNGLVLWLSDSQTISGVSEGLVDAVIGTRLLGVSLGFWYGLLLCLVLWYVFEYTALGRRLLFVGRGRRVAALSGLQPRAAALGRADRQRHDRRARGRRLRGGDGWSRPLERRQLPAARLRRRLPRRHRHRPGALQPLGVADRGVLLGHGHHRPDHPRCGLVRYGLDTVRAASEHLMDHSERMLRREIERLPDGRYEAEGFMDGFLDHPDEGYRNLRVNVAVTVAGSDLHVDLAGTADQIDLPINMPFEGTVDIAIYLTLRAILLDTTRHNAVVSNQGLFRPITISAPEGSLANPRFPAPTIARFCPGNIIADTLMRALAPVLPEAVSAGVGNLKVVAYSGERDGAAWVYMDIVEGSYGGRHGKDGLDAVDTLYANTRNNPIEDIESHYPLRVRRYELVEQGAGAGRWRGGLGSIRDIEFLDEGGFSLEGDGNLVPPPGLFGGRPGRPGSVTLNPGSDAAQSLTSKIPYRKARAGDVLSLVGPCGGGYGDPAERDPEAIAADTRNGLEIETR